MLTPMPFLASFLLVACTGDKGGDDTGAPSTDGGTTDAGTTDGGLSDGGSDGGGSDGGLSDGGGSDGGTTDGGLSDGGTTTVVPVSDVVIEVHSEVSTVLVVSWNQDEAVDGAWLEFSFEDDDWLSSPTLPRELGAQQEVVLGVPANTDVSVRIGLQRGDETSVSDTWTTHTGALPAVLDEGLVLSHDPALASTERWMMTTLSVGSSVYGYGGPMWVIIMDRQGRIVWYREVPESRLSLFAQIASDGSHILWDGTTHYVFDGTAAIITAATLDLSHEETFEPDGLGFSFDEIDGGTILYNAERGDYLLVERQPDGTETTIWNCSDYMADRGLSSYYCAPNSVVWNPSTDTIFWSMYTCDTILELDRSGTVLKELGQLSGGWAFDPPGSVVDYQHYPSLTPEGNLIVSTHIVGESGQQRTREWVLDEETETATEVWNYGEDSGLYALYGGEGFRLDNGNTLMNYGTGGAVREVTADKEVAWDVEWPLLSGYRLLGHNSLVDDLYALNEGPSD